MLATIAKQFTFHAAHQLINHDGPCSRPHGHTYKLEVIVTGHVKELDGNSDEGMVIDFNELKRIYTKNVEPFVEHRDLNDIEGLNPTTSERIAGWIHRVFQRELNPEITKHVTGLCIRLWESPSSYAEVGRAPWRG